MGLETASNITQLNANNPVTGDDVNQGANHIRLIKAALLASFSGFTGAANVTVTEAQLNAAVATLAAGISVLSQSGVTFATNTKDGFLNPNAGEVDIVATNGGSPASSVAIAKFLGSNQSAAFQGPVSAVGPITGPGTVPIGGMILWPSNAGPADGNWIWANGQALSRTTYSQLFSQWGTTYGAGDGSTTFNVPNMQEVVPLGRSTMGGAASPGHLPNEGSGKTLLGTIFGQDVNQLTTANLPPYTPSGSITNGAISSNANVPTYSGADNAAPQGGPSYPVYTGTATWSQGTSTFTGNPQGGSSAIFTNIQPVIVMNYLIRAY